jgi:hypothetical protein
MIKKNDTYSLTTGVNAYPIHISRYNIPDPELWLDVEGIDILKLTPGTLRELFSLCETGEVV